MSANVNSCHFIGNITKDLELKHVQSGTAVANFSLAVNHKYKEKEETLFVGVQVWGKLAEIICQYGKKGQSAYVSGRLTMRKYTDKNGVERQDWSIVAENVQLLGSGNGTKQAASSHRVSAEIDDEIPF